jgi:taurine dioxygenase
MTLLRKWRRTYQQIRRGFRQQDRIAYPLLIDLSEVRPMDSTIPSADAIIKPLTRRVGAEVTGLDISRPLNTKTVDVLSKAFDEYIALVFRGQTLTEQEQIRFAQNFGPLGLRQRSPKDIRAGGGATRGHVMLVTNIVDAANTSAGSYGDGEMWFHADSCYYEIPNRATFLYSVELPSSGGNTRVSSMYAAYDNVPQRLRERLEGRRVLQIHDHKRRERLDLDRIVIAELRHHWQPIFVTHPRTGRRALYVNRLMTAEIEGLDRIESDAILDELFTISEDPDNYYEHEWRPGDLLMWDNYASIHMRTDFPNDERRLLRRCTVAGDGPLSF